MLSAIAGACLCVFVNAEFLFGTFCLVLTHAVQVTKFPNKNNEQVLVCFVLMVAWGLSAALCHCRRLLGHVFAHMSDYHAIQSNNSSTDIAWNYGGFMMPFHMYRPGSW